MAATGASLNHENSLKGKNSSRSSTRIQNPCAEILDTSAVWEVLAPRILDLLSSLSNKLKRPIQDLVTEAIVLRHLDIWLHPELCLALRCDDMDVHAPLLEREEV